MTTMRLAVLYVDDDDDIRTIVQLALGLDPEMTVHGAATGEEALAAVAAGFAPDVIALDVMMPGMDGPTLLARLRALPGLAAVPAVFMTAKARAADIAEYRAIGAADVISKPFSPMDLAARLRAIARR